MQFTEVQVSNMFLLWHNAKKHAEKNVATKIQSHFARLTFARVMY